MMQGMGRSLGPVPGPMSSIKPPIGGMHPMPPRMGMQHHPPGQHQFPQQNTSPQHSNSPAPSEPVPPAVQNLSKPVSQNMPANVNHVAPSPPVTSAPTPPVTSAPSQGGDAAKEPVVKSDATANVRTSESAPVSSVKPGDKNENSDKPADRTALPDVVTSAAESLPVIDNVEKPAEKMVSTNPPKSLDSILEKLNSQAVEEKSLPPKVEKSQVEKKVVEPTGPVQESKQEVKIEEPKPAAVEADSKPVNSAVLNTKAVVSESSATSSKPAETTVSTPQVQTVKADEKSVNSEPKISKEPVVDKVVEKPIEKEITKSEDSNAKLSTAPEKKEVVDKPKEENVAEKPEESNKIKEDKSDKKPSSEPTSAKFVREFPPAAQKEDKNKGEFLFY